MNRLLVFEQQELSWWTCCRCCFWANKQGGKSAFFLIFESLLPCRCRQLQKDPRLSDEWWLAGCWQRGVSCEREEATSTTSTLQKIRTKDLRQKRYQPLRTILYYVTSRHNRAFTKRLVSSILPTIPQRVSFGGIPKPITVKCKRGPWKDTYHYSTTINEIVSFSRLPINVHVRSTWPKQQNYSSEFMRKRPFYFRGLLWLQFPMT